MIYILILIMNIDSGNNGQGGLAMHEFSSQSSCEEAGLLFLREFRRGFFNIPENIQYMCVKK